MKSDDGEKSVIRSVAKVWDDRWVRFRLALKQRGVEVRAYDFYRGWVLGFVRFIKPMKFEEAGRTDVEGYISKLAGEGKKMWQVRQAEEALRVMFEEVDPREWALEWPEEMLQGVREDLDRDDAAEAPPGPVGNPARFEGRSDEGELPERYEAFVEEVRQALRVERYSYRTEKTYADWARRFLVFARPESRSGIVWDAGSGGGVSAGGAFGEISERGNGVDLVLVVPRRGALARPMDGEGSQASRE